MARQVSGAPLADLNFAPQCSDIRVLRVSEPLSNTGLDNLAIFEDLRVLDVTLAGNYAYKVALRLGSALVRLSLNGGQQFYIEDLASCLRLQSLALHYCNVTDIASVPLPKATHAIQFHNCNVGTSMRRPTAMDLSSAKSLEIVGGALDNLAFLSRFPTLRKFVLRDVNVSHDINGISSIPDNCEVTIEGLPTEIDDEPIERLREEQRCFINYEQRLTWEYQADSGGS